MYATKFENLDVYKLLLFMFFRGHSLQIVKNLTILLQNIQKEHYFALKLIIIDWVKQGDIRNEEIKLLWERFTLKQPDTSENDSRAALLLLDIVAE